MCCIRVDIRYNLTFVVSKMDEKVHKNKKKKKGKAHVISFDEEIVPKDAAAEILAKEKTQNGEDQKTEETSRKRAKERKKIENTQNPVEPKPKKKKKTKNNSIVNDEERITDDDNDKIKSKKKKSGDETLNEQGEVDNTDAPRKKKKKRNALEPEKQETGEEPNPDKPEPKKTESIRERKRKKHAQLVKDKKLKADLALQEKSLNYLSKWKHSRSDWKFEKLRQIWLQQNMYDSSKVPSEFWETIVDYFSNCKGKARDIILKEAVKIIEEVEGLEDGKNEENSVKIERARDIIQNLQE